VIPLEHLGLLEQPVKAFAERERRPHRCRDRRQRLARTPVRHLIASMEVCNQVKGPGWRQRRLNRGELIDVGHVRHDEAGLAAVLEQGRESRRWCTVGVHHQERVPGLGAQCRCAEAGRGQAPDLVGAEFDQPVDLIAERGQDRQSTRHANTSRRSRQQLPAERGTQQEGS